MYLKIRIFLVKSIVIDRRTLKCEGCLLYNTMKGLRNGDEVEWNRSNSLHIHCSGLLNHQHILLCFYNEQSNSRSSWTKVEIPIHGFFKSWFLLSVYTALKKMNVGVANIIVLNVTFHHFHDYPWRCLYSRTHSYNSMNSYEH